MIFVRLWRLEYVIGNIECNIFVMGEKITASFHNIFTQYTGAAERILNFGCEINNYEKRKNFWIPKSNDIANGTRPALPTPIWFRHHYFQKQGRNKFSMYFTMKSKIEQSKCAILLLINKNKNHSKAFSNISPKIGLRATCKSENSYYNKKCYTW